MPVYVLIQFVYIFRFLSSVDAILCAISKCLISFPIYNDYFGIKVPTKHFREKEREREGGDR